MLLAHRGWASRYPENSRAGIEAALQAGVRSVEIDIQLSGDSVPMVIHDATLERTAGVDRRVSDLNADACHQDPAQGTNHEAPDAESGRRRADLA